jgi:hypothetical protein
MAGSTSGGPCAAHNCLKPRWQDGLCAAHWFAHQARLQLHAEREAHQDSIAICQAIWDAS